PSRISGGGRLFQSWANSVPVRSAWVVENSQAKLPPSGSLRCTLVRLIVRLSYTLNVNPRIVTGFQSMMVTSSSIAPLGIPSKVIDWPGLGGSSVDVGFTLGS